MRNPKPGPQHSPGPWTIEPVEESNDLLVWGPHEAGLPRGPRDYVAKIGIVGALRKQANAHLIAAAPDLLAAVLDALQVWDASRTISEADILAMRRAAMKAVPEVLAFGIERPNE